MTIGGQLRRGWRTFWRRSRLVNNEPLNRVSLIVIILVDIFILINVFSGLAEIGNWLLSPSQAQPCYAPWQAYRQQTGGDRHWQFIEQQIRDTLPQPSETRPPTFLEALEQSAVGKLGQRFAPISRQLPRQLSGNWGKSLRVVSPMPAIRMQ